MSSTKQLDLFGSGRDGPSGVDVKKLRERIPPGIRFGAIGWCHPQWGELVWPGPRTAEELERKGLPEYAADPRFSTLCLVPGSEPLRDQALRRYAAQLPAIFGAMIEAHAMVTAPRLTRAAGSSRGHVRVNPQFFDARLFERELYDPAVNTFGDRLHWMVLVFPADVIAAGVPPTAFAQRLERFLASVPNPARCAIEVREPTLLTLEYARVLASTGAANVFSTAPGMPSFAEQARWAPSGGEAIFRLADPLGGQYPSNTQRRSALVDAIMEHPQRRAIVLVNDDAEGSAPETTDRLLRQTADRFALEPDVAFAGGAFE